MSDGEGSEGSGSDLDSDDDEDDDDEYDDEYDSVSRYFHSPFQTQPICSREASSLLMKRLSKKSLWLKKLNALN
jgi:hypothetical protein